MCFITPCAFHNVSREPLCAASAAAAPIESHAKCRAAFGEKQKRLSFTTRHYWLNIYWRDTKLSCLCLGRLRAAYCPVGFVIRASVLPLLALLRGLAEGGKIPRSVCHVRVRVHVHGELCVVRATVAFTYREDTSDFQE